MTAHEGFAERVVLCVEERYQSGVWYETTAWIGDDKLPYAQSWLEKLRSAGREARLVRRVGYIRIVERRIANNTPPPEPDQVIA